jgi:GntR family transcriptional repressor for pyruvate dehydrogenase complex
VILDLLDARLLIEPHLARLAAERCDDDAVAELAGILASAENVLQGRDDLLSELNMDFHHSIARLSGNVVLHQTIDSLLDLYAGERMVILQLFDNRERDHREHVGIFDALRDRRADLAAGRMQEHLEGVRSVLEGRLRTEAGRR